MHDTRSYKIFQGGYVIPTKDDKPADYVKVKPPVFHCQVFMVKRQLRFTPEKLMQKQRWKGRTLLDVELVDHMGDDLTVVNAARVSFGKKKEVFDFGDTRLIKFLANMTTGVLLVIAVCSFILRHLSLLQDNWSNTK